MKKKSAIQELELLKGLEILVNNGDLEKAALHFEVGLSIKTENSVFCWLLLSICKSCLGSVVPKNEILQLVSKDQDELKEALNLYKENKEVDLMMAVYLQRFNVTNFITNDIPDWFTFDDNGFLYRKDYHLNYTRTITRLDIETFVLLCGLEQQYEMLKCKSDLNSLLKLTINETRSKYYTNVMLEMDKDKIDLKQKQQMLLELRGLVYTVYKPIYAFIGIWYSNVGNNLAARYYLTRFKEMNTPNLKQFSKETTRPILFLDLMTQFENYFDNTELLSRVEICLAGLDSKVETTPKSSPMKMKLMDKLEKTRELPKTPVKGEVTENTVSTPIVSTKGIPGYFSTPVKQQSPIKLEAVY